jgi:alpha 1,2-mannosyltransferase
MVLVLSSFAEVLYLDSDNVAVTDPEALFSEAMYNETGTLFWNDFWAADWAPDAPLILGVNETGMPQTSVESGQMLLDKERCVRG